MKNLPGCCMRILHSSFIILHFLNNPVSSLFCLLHQRTFLFSLCVAIASCHNRMLRDVAGIREYIHLPEESCPPVYYVIGLLERTSADSASAYGNHILRIGHLVVKSFQYRSHFIGDCSAYHNHISDAGWHVLPQTQSGTMS